MLTRRDFIRYSALGSLVPVTAMCQRAVRWQPEAFRKTEISQVAILHAARYDLSLRQVITDGVRLCGLTVKGKRIILKPNLVEFDRKSVVNTDVAMIEAAVVSFRSLGAQEVIIAEGPGHRRDNEYLLEASGLDDVIREHGVRYVDLNTDDVRQVNLRSYFTNLKRLYLPETLYHADLLVSMPKLKTHHWAGVTLSLKNMFGVVPGSIYGWPKNILHWQGIHNSILDINSSLPLRQFAIVDGVVGMEGNGPLQGQAKASEVVVFGEDLVAVDATATRLMRLDPSKIRYLADAGEFLGNLQMERIKQVGEQIESLQQEFDVLDEFHSLRT